MILFTGDDDDDLNYSAILSAIALCSAIIVSQSLLRELQHDAHWIQFALLISLILVHNIIIIKTNHQDMSINPSNESATNYEDGNQKNVKDKEKQSLIFTNSILELCYFEIFLALFISLLCHKQNYIVNSRKQNRKWTHFISFMKIGMKSLVLSLLFVIYCIFFRKLSHLKQNRDNSNDTKDNIIGHGMDYFFILCIIWAFFIFWTWRRRRYILAGSYRVNVHASHMRLPYQGNPPQEYEAYNNENSWDQWSNDKLLNWIRSIYHQQMHAFHQNSNYTTNRYLQHNCMHYQHGQEYGPQYHEGGMKSQIRVHVDEDTIIHILETIRLQSLNGSILPYVEVHDLVVMGIEYIHAVFLHSNFRALIDSSRPSRNHNFTNKENEKVGTGIDLDEWLGKKTGSSPSSGSKVDDFKNHEEQERIQDNIQEMATLPQYDHVNGIMAAKFGMELPQVTHPGSGSDVIPVPIPSSKTGYRSIKTVERNTSSTSKTNDISSASPPFSRDSNINELDQNLLAQMPPNIRNIACKHPDLVMAMQEKLLSQSSQEIRPNTRRNKMVRFKDDNFEDNVAPEDEEGEEYTGWNESTVDADEMVGLIRRRRFNT